MAEKRVFPRKKKRLLVDFVVDGVKATGFTWDLSNTGMFIATARMPQIGSMLKACLHLPDGKNIDCVGTVVRARKVPARLTSLEANGFSLQFEGYIEDYHRFLASLG